MNPDRSQILATTNQRRNSLLYSGVVLLGAVPVLLLGSRELTAAPVFSVFLLGILLVAELVLGYLLMARAKLSAAPAFTTLSAAVALPAVALLSVLPVVPLLDSVAGSQLVQLVLLAGVTTSLLLILVCREIRHREWARNRSSRIASSPVRWLVVGGVAGCSFAFAIVWLALPLVRSPVQTAVAVMAVVAAAVVPVRFVRQWRQADRLRVIVLPFVVGMALTAVVAVRYPQDGTLGWRTSQLALVVMAVLGLVLTLVLENRGNLRQLVLIADLMAERRQQSRDNAIWRTRSTTDEMTGLITRSALLEQVSTGLQGDQPFVVAMFDLDGFKEVNDNYGHAAGDAVLTALAHRIATSCRPGDSCGRLGGDEFALLMPGFVDEQSVNRRLNSIVARLAEPVHLDDHLLQVTASCGYLVAQPGQVSREQVLRNADNALYRAKAAGGNSVVRWGGSDSALSEAVVASVSDVGLSDLSLDYQPIRDLGRGEIENFEALLRVRQPDGSSRETSEVIRGFAEQGRMGEVGRQVLRLVETDLLSDEAHTALVSVNLSSQELRSEQMQACLQGGELAAVQDRLILEVKESALASPDIVKRVVRLREAGYRIAIDDFGGLGGSLQILDQVRPYLVKLSADFVGDLDDGESIARRLRLAADLIRQMGAKSVFKGVETPEQSVSAAATGFDLGQGFLLGGPESVPLAAAGR